jgi:periplasmic copper chaperone A
VSLPLGRPVLKALVLTLALAVAASIATPAVAGGALGTSGDIVATEGSARAAPGARSGAGYLVLTNNGDEGDRLLAAESPAAERVELHTHHLEDGIARMVEIEDIPLPPGQSVALAQGGDHLMFMGLTEAWDPEAGVSVRLVFERAGALEVMLPVAAGPPSGLGHGHGHGGDGPHHGQEPGGHGH